MTMALLPICMASAQTTDDDKYAIRATAEKNIANALLVDYAVPGMSTSSSSWDYSLEFAWEIWKQGKNVLEANVGLGYGSTTLKAHLPVTDYHYDAPVEADMDAVPYIRYYNLDGLSQKIKTQRFTLPLYVNYRYKFSKVFSLHALFGFRFGFNFKSKLDNEETKVFSYGVYPQYDDLMIDAEYMNEFGARSVGAKAASPRFNVFNPAFLFGLGAEFRIYGPIALDLSVKYEGGMEDMFKAPVCDITNFDALNAPVTYTVAEGQKVTSLSSYLSMSKMSNLSYAISILYRF